MKKLIVIFIVWIVAAVTLVGGTVALADYVYNHYPQPGEVWAK
mgnify:CR=1 FL=1